LSSAILRDTSQIESLQAEATFAAEAKKKAYLLAWLLNHEHSKEQHDNISCYKEGTGMWLLDDQKIQGVHPKAQAC
jgi:hypothetical protein